MFKSARWRFEKSKIKAVFKLQFYATQVTGDALMITIVPADAGKATLKLEKALVHNGSCYWESAAYETVKFNRDQKSGKIHERIYTFVVGTGSSKSRVVGEASIDFSSYADATKVSYVSLPLKNSKSGAILHVSIKRIQDCQSTIEEIEPAKPALHDRTLRAQLSIVDMDEGDIKNFDESPENKTASHVPTLNGRTESSESDTTLSSSESSLGLDTPQEVETRSNDIHENRANSLPDLNNASDVIEKLRSELTALSRQVGLSELELQTLRKQIVKENKRGHDLSREIANIREERDVLKEECEKLKASQSILGDAKSGDKLLHPDKSGVQDIVEELRHELNYQKEINANLQTQLETTQESNSELIVAVHDLDEMLKQKNKEIMNLSSKPVICEDAVDLQDANSKCDIAHHVDEEQKALEELVREQSGTKEIYLLEQKIVDIQSEIDIQRRDKDELEMQMEQLALDYEILKQENHEMHYKLEQSQLQEQLNMQYECSSSYATLNGLEAQIEVLENELKKQSKEFSDSLVTITKHEARINILEEELESQARGFESDLEALARAKVEQEQRAIRAEEALRKTRWQNAATAERLQVEFKRLSLETASSFETNEKMAIKAFTEANELRLQKRNLEETIQKTYGELHSVREHYEEMLREISNEVNMMLGQILLQFEIDEKSSRLENVETHAHSLSHEIIMLKAEVENLIVEKKVLSEHANKSETLACELESMRKSMKEMESMLEQGNAESSKLEIQLASVLKEAEQTHKELNSMRCLKDDRETLVVKLQEEIDTLRTQCSELRSCVCEDELEKERLRNHVSHLEGDIKKKEDALNILDKKLKDADNKVNTVNGVRTASESNNFALADSLKEVSSLKERIKLLEDQITLKEHALETSCNAFLGKEKNLQDKVEELEARLEELDQSTSRLCKHLSEEVATEDLSVNYGTGDEQVKRDLDKLLNEVVLLKEKNTLMESELKEMQERYSEVSLKFAEVEGERQQLMMKLRNRKTQ